jgi:hypothetical protein
VSQVVATVELLVKEMVMQTMKTIALALIVLACAPKASNSQSAMTFFMETDPEKRLISKTVRNGIEDVFASGEIVEGTTEDFIDFVRTNSVEAAKVHFNSPGGSLTEGMRLGSAIRHMGFHTTVGKFNPTYEPNSSRQTICASACAYAFAGGTSRFLNEYTGRLGVHQFYVDGDGGLSAEAAQYVSGLIVSYLDQMGIDTKAFTISTTADRNGMIWLTLDEATKLRLANNGSDAPVAEIRLADMVPYLRVQQDHHGASTRVLFYCNEKVIQMAFGIVTDAETSLMIAGSQKRSYLELDRKEFLTVLGSHGAEAVDDVVWIGRDLTQGTLEQISGSMEISGWVDGFGAVRWGSNLQMPTVRDQIIDFASQCYR